ncbi:hypothetical protein POTG_01731 [Paenibacillus sp. oral taxon 786 str. D14]|uniref:hypothetical protein n=1 Tax=Paenibacillus sp. oral taxon 786 TaxID=652715 RepID=UPI0001AFD276|nr:hypothetical protein [Paenibacillus sp. oral taxon 786]EES73436.1 hypothetical protein POTG_01731 [Paenibacillus sp. oral taxon 786 str. D14]
MYKVACTKKEMSCLISNLFQELIPACEPCRSQRFDDDFVLTGVLAGMNEIATIRVTDYGFEYYGNIDVLNQIRGRKCLYATIAPTEESGSILK